ncbi:MAG: AAA family ATPase [Planctomycetota bacterium]
MDGSLSIGVFNTEPEQRDALRNVVAQVEGLQLVHETGRWEELEAALADGALDVVLVNLDDDSEFGNSIVQHIVRIVPGMSVVGVSRRTDPGTIISAMRAGCCQFVCAPMDVPDFRNAMERIRATRMAVPHRSWRICVVGAAGGVGATTIACNLAIELAQLTHRTCALVDLNLEYGDAAFSFDCEPKFSRADLCATGSPIDRTVVESAVHQLPCNVALLARPAKLSEAHLVTPEGVEQMLKVLRSIYPYVVVDLPRSYSFLSSVALRDADLVMIVTQLSIGSLRNASRVFDLLLESGADAEHIEIVLNRHAAQHQRVAPEDVEQHFRRPSFAMIPNDYRQVTAASDFGHPMMADAPESPARLAILELAKTIAGDRRTGTQPSPTPVNQGRLKRWWGGRKAPANTVNPEARRE